MLALEVVGSNFQVLQHRQKRLSPGTYGTLVHEIHPKERLGCGFKDFLFSSVPGEMIQFDQHIFQMTWVETTN